MSKNIELYEKTCDILYNSYFKDNLKHNICTACAVGNICGNGEWVKMFSTTRVPLDAGEEVFMTDGINHQRAYPERLERVEKFISHTGYTWQELAKIEFAFESAERGINDEDYMFNGLVAVLDVLKEIHEIEDDEPQVSRFKSHYQAKVNV